jgi:hypothetical protein
MAIQQYPSYDNIATTLTWKKTATAGQTSISGLDDFGQTLIYNAGIEQLYLNGVLLVRMIDYTATDGSTITIPAMNAGDYIQVICWSPYSVASSASSGTSESFHPFLLMGA